MQIAIINKTWLGRKILFAAITSAFISVTTGLVYTQEQQPKQYQPSQQTSGGQGANTTVVVSSDEDYLIGPSDVIEIKIEDAPELSGTFRVNAKGLFILPIVGQLNAEKKTTEEIAKTIADKLRGDYLMNPIVSVIVKQSNSRAFFIQGAVRRPGIYQIEGRPSLLKLITIAGGLADNYGSTAFIMREKKGVEKIAGSQQIPVENKTELENENPTSQDGADQTNESGDYDLIKANINNLLRGNLEQNLIIQTGDIVHIPMSDVFFVAGEVKAPGSFPLKEGTTLRQAISLAQGTNFEGDLSKSVIFREGQTGKREEIGIDVGAVMAGKKPDIEIFANDIIIVPNSKKRTVVKGLSKTISGGLLRLLLGF